MKIIITDVRYNSNVSTDTGHFKLTMIAISKIYNFVVPYTKWGKIIIIKIINTALQLTIANYCYRPKLFDLNYR